MNEWLLTAKAWGSWQAARRVRSLPRELMPVRTRAPQSEVAYPGGPARPTTPHPGHQFTGNFAKSHILKKNNNMHSLFKKKKKTKQKCVNSEVHVPTAPGPSRCHPPARRPRVTVAGARPTLPSPGILCVSHASGVILHGTLPHALFCRPACPSSVPCLPRERLFCC